MMEKLLAGKITWWCMRHCNDANTNEIIVQYGIELILNNTLKLLLLMIIGTIFQRGMETFTVLMVFGFLRYFTGGSHRKTNIRCFLNMAAIGFLAIISSNLLFTYSESIRWGLLCCCFIIVWYFAPRNSEANPIRDKNLLHRKKVNSLIVLVFIGILSIFVPKQFGILVVVAAFIETLTVLPICKGERIIDKNKR